MEYGNDPLDSMTGEENMLANLGEIVNSPGINQLMGAFKGKPAVVVATGPSLDKNKHLLKGLEDKAVIIAADASLKPLLAMGVRPHLVATLEREMDVVKLFDGLTVDQLTDSYLAACPVVFPEVYQSYPGPHIVVYRNFDHFKWLEIDRGILNIKFSAGNMGFSLAQYMACDPIILIGQDLAIDGNKTNADGAVLGTEQDSYLREPRYMVEANAGGMTQTTRSLKMFLDAYNNDMTTHPGLVINATEGGAKINRTEIMPFQEAIAGHITEDIHPLAVIRERLAAFSPGEDGAKIEAKVEYTIGKFGEMIGYAEEGIRCIDGHKEELEALRMKPVEERMKEIMVEMTEWRKKIQSDFPTWQLFFAHIGQAWFLNFELEIKTFRKKYRDAALAEMVLAYREWFEMMIRFFRVCIMALNKHKGELA
jgi:hypothetical protein